MSESDPKMDRISRLPDDVICHILSFLPTKHSVATSVLSSRWVNLWSFVPVIDLDDRVYLNPSKKPSISEHFIRFTERVLSENQSETIAKFRLHMHYRYGVQALSNIDAFLHNVISRNVVEIDLGIFYDVPVSDDRVTIPHCESLKVLKVTTHYYFTLPAFPGCFPSLRVFDVSVSVKQDDEWITNLFPCLPALEKLRLFGNLDVSRDYHFNIAGAALKHLELGLMMNSFDYDECDAVVVIDAPKLDYLKLQDSYLASYLLKNKSAISEVMLDLGNYYKAGQTHRTRFNELLHSFCNTKVLSVSESTLKVFFVKEWSKLPVLPVLSSLTKLELDLTARSWKLLLHWLESCPNLRVLSFTIKEQPVVEFEEVVPSCLSSCVKEIEIKSVRKVDLEEMVNYFLANAKVLDKFEVGSRVYFKDEFWKAWVDMCIK